jgi:hypothetical protein
VSPLIIALNTSLLFMCVSMYFGTGWSLVLFSFPLSPQLTVDNYYLEFVPQVNAATRFFTWMTSAMCVFGVTMLVCEWHSPLVWVPAVVLGAIVAATLLTVVLIFPLNRLMAAKITDPAVLRDTLARWMSLNRVRVGLWSAQWVAMMAYFAIRAFEETR